MIKLYFCFITAALIGLPVFGFKIPTKHIISYAVNTNSQAFFHNPSAAARHTKSFKTSPLSLMIGPIDVPLIPAVLLSTGAVFAVFNIDNKVDLTDAGRAQSKKQRRLEREAKGEYKKPADPNADPFRYKWFEENDDDEFELLNKPKGGGCG